MQCPPAIPREDVDDDEEHEGALDVYVRDVD